MYLFVCLFVCLFGSNLAMLKSAMLKFATCHLRLPRLGAANQACAQRTPFSRDICNSIIAKLDPVHNDS